MLVIDNPITTAIDRIKQVFSYFMSVHQSHHNNLLRPSPNLPQVILVVIKVVIISKAIVRIIDISFSTFAKTTLVLTSAITIIVII